MAFEVTALIGTFGSDQWFANGRVLESNLLRIHENLRVHHVHGDSLASARAELISMSRTEYSFFLDADDWIKSDYLFHLDRYANRFQGNVLFKPSVSNGSDKPRQLKAGDMWVSNELVIGTAFRTEFIVNRWDESLESHEDWDFWLTQLSHGASIAECPEMVYMAQQREGSRNSHPNQRETARRIREKHRSHRRSVTRL